MSYVFQSPKSPCLTVSYNRTFMMKIAFKFPNMTYKMKMLSLSKMNKICCFAMFPGPYLATFALITPFKSQNPF